MFVIVGPYGMVVQAIVVYVESAVLSLSSLVNEVSVCIRSLSGTSRHRFVVVTIVRIFRKTFSSEPFVVASFGFT